MLRMIEQATKQNWLPCLSHDVMSKAFRGLIGATT